MAKNSKPYVGKIPFDRDGNQEAYGHGTPDDPAKWRGEVWVDNTVFDDELEYQSYGTGRSSIGFSWKSLNSGKKYSMFISELHDCMKHITQGVLIGQFTFIKRGTGYSIKFIQ